MSFLFSIREGVRGMAKTRMASTLSISSIMLTLFLIGIFGMFVLNLQSGIGKIRQQIKIELFVETIADDKDVAALKKEILAVNGVESVEYISKEQAAARYKNESGEDVVAVLGFNPLPASFLISLKEQYRTLARVSLIKTSLEDLSYVDEVKYHRPLLEKLDRYVEYIYIGLTIISIIIFLIAVALINNTIRLTIYARRDLIQIMRLVGATEGFVRRPFIVEGILQGFIGAIIASVFIYYLSQLIRSLVYTNLVFEWFILYGLAFVGVVLGMISAYLSVGKYLRNI